MNIRPWRRSGERVTGQITIRHRQARATSPDAIIEASRTGKGQFYHYFKSKEGLVHEVLQTYLREIKTGTSPLNYEINSWRELEK